MRGAPLFVMATAALLAASVVVAFAQNNDSRLPAPNNIVGSRTAAKEPRIAPREVLVEVANTANRQAINALQRRHRLARIERRIFRLAGTTLYRWRIPDQRSVTAVVRSLQADRVVAAAQPNHLFTLQQSEAP